MGGRTVRTSSSLTHEYIGYDISRISDSLLIFHIHPAEYVRSVKSEIFGKSGAEYEYSIIYSATILSLHPAILQTDDPLFCYIHI
jgi:hypothetical protein